MHSAERYTFVASERGSVVVHLAQGVSPAVVAKTKAVVDTL